MISEHAQVLEFGLESERYCIEIEHVAEITGKTALTSVPNAAEYVLGVMDLRGTSLHVIDPKTAFGVDSEPIGQRVLVLDPSIGDDDRRYGWLVDDVSDVLDVTAEDIDRSIDEPGVYGALRDEERLIVWVDPESVIEP